MSQISPPIRILLVAVIGLCAVYMLFLRPKPEEAAPVATTPAAATAVPAKDPNAQTASKPGAAVQQAVRGADSASARADAAAGGQIAESEGGVAASGQAPASTGVNTSPVTEAPAPGKGAQPAPLTKQSLAALPADVRKAVERRKVLALLFYNNRSDDDKATRRALARVDRFGGQVFVDAHWIKNVAQYQAITRGADLEQSPTVVVVDRNLKAESLVGYVDSQTIEQAVVDALRASGGSAIKDPYFRRLDAVCQSAEQQAKALGQPATASALPAFLAAAVEVSAGLDAKAAAVKAPKRHAGFDRAFNRLNAASTDVLSKAAADAKANPAKARSILTAATAKGKRMEKRFVSKHGAHGLSCF
jgi:hypothetical protein